MNSFATTKRLHSGQGGFSGGAAVSATMRHLGLKLFNKLTAIISSSLIVTITIILNTCLYIHIYINVCIYTHKSVLQEPPISKASTLTLLKFDSAHFGI
jgi:hypothetical protein